MSKKILLIDSDETFALSLSHAMTSRGFAATLATNSEQGMSMAKEDNPDLIVVCVEAQPTNGYMLCTRLKKDDRLKGIPVILTSANATADSFEKHKKLKTRAEEYLIKPFEPIVMLEKASQLLGMQLPAESMEEEILSVDDEPLGLNDLVPGEDEPLSLSDGDLALAHEEPLGAMEVEEVQELAEDAAAQDDDLEMFDKAFDSLGGPPLQQGRQAQQAHALAEEADEPPRFGDLMVVPDEPISEPPPQAKEEALLDEAEAPPADLAAPDDPDLLQGFDEEPILEASGASAEDEVRAHLEGRVAELEHALAEREAELSQAKKGSGSTSSAEVLRLKEAKNRGDKEVLRLKEELNAKDKELVDLQERETALESQAQQLKDDAAKREAAAKALQQRADALGAAAKKFERELTAAREEAKKTSAAQGKASELEKAHEDLRKQHEALSADLEKHQERAGQLETELEGTREMHSDALATAQAEVAKAREELEKLRTEVTALAGEKDLISEEREELKKQLEEARATASQNEDRAVKAYQKIKNDDKLREKTRKALQIALQLLEDDAEEADLLTAEKKSA